MALPVPPAIGSAAGDAGALSALVQRSCDRRAGPLLLAVACGQGNALATDLRNNGFSVIRRAVYAAEPVTSLPEQAYKAIVARSLAVALFFSTETARTCVRLVQSARLDQAVRSVEALSIGQTAAMALQVLPWRRIRVAAQPNQDVMLALLR